MKLDLIIAGSAGQGVITMSGILTRAAVSEGYDAHYYSQSGIAQLEVPVTSHVRIGSPTAGPSPKIPRGKADFIAAMDQLEAMRVCDYLVDGGTAIIDKTGSIPVGARSGRFHYPTKEEVEKVFDGRSIIWVPASEISRELGTPVLAGAVILGALSALSEIVERDNIVLSLRETMPTLADEEAEAFYAGFDFISDLEG